MVIVVEARATFVEAKVEYEVPRNCLGIPYFRHPSFLVCQCRLTVVETALRKV